MLRNLKYKSLYIGLTTCLIIFLFSAPLFAGNATLFWEPPTTNTDGTPLTDLAGFIIYDGTATGLYSNSTNVGNVTTYQVGNLTEGFTYYLAITAYDTSGNESEYSNEVSKTISPPSPEPDITVTDSVAPVNDLQIPFGNVTGGYYSDQTVTVTNDGNVSLEIGNIAQADPLLSPFSILNDNCSGQTIIPSGNCILTVRFSPTTTASFSDTFDIPSDDPDENPVTVSISGTGVSSVNNPPAANPGGPYTATEGQAVTLDGSGSSDSDGSIVLYEWDTDNDGTYDYSSSSPIQGHTYAQQGTYSVKLKVTDNIGATDEAITTASISDTSPTAGFSGSPTSGTAPLTVNFSSNSTGYDQPLTYEWDFDNNGSIDSTTQNPSYTYTIQGVYTVKLTVTDSDGSTNTLTRTDYITVLTTLPPVLEIYPASITDTLMQGNSSTNSLTLSNTGGSTLTYSVYMTETSSPANISVVSGYQTEKPPAISSIPEGVEYVPGEIIVKFSHDALMERVSELKDETGATLKRNIPRLNMEVWKLSSNKEQSMLETIAVISKDPNIIYVEPNYIYEAVGIPNDPGFSELWGLHNQGQTGGTAGADIDIPEAWDIFTGSPNVVVAVIDTGVDYNHEDLAANMWTNTGEIPGNGIDDDGNGYIDDDKGWDFSTCAEFNTDGTCKIPKPENNDPYDDVGHGTHSAGTIGAVGNNGIGVAGVNWNLKIMPLKFLNSYGQGSTIDAIGAILYAIDMGADITSNSWGGGGFSQSLKDAIQMASDAGVLFIAAAGNDGTDNDSNPYYPSNYDVPNVIAVAATDHNDDLAWFSNYGGTSVDLAAPGEDIFSTFPPGVYLSSSCNDNDGDGYGYCSGTSMATPHVAGVAALLRGYNPALSALDNKNLIMNSVDPVDSLTGRTVTGGRLNANSALMMTRPDWIRVSGELSGQILPGFSTDLTVLLDATGKTAGDYEAEITIISNDPVDSVKVIPVTMTVLPGETYSISGTVKTPGGGRPGSPISGVTMTLSGNASGTTTTNSSGNYTFTGLANGSYTVTTGKAGYAFTPTSRSVTLSSNRAGQNFTGTYTGAPTYSISGTVLSGGSPLAGVTMALTGDAGGTATTNGSGNYTFAGLPDGSYTVTPGLAGYAFMPAGSPVTISGADATGVDFTGTATGGGNYSISGTVKTPDSGSPGGPISGVTMTLSGDASGTTTTNGSGNYTFTGLANGSYTVTPGKSGYTFTPTSRAVTISGANRTGQNFTGN